MAKSHHGLKGRFTPQEYLKETMVHITGPRNIINEVVTAASKAMDKLDKQDPALLCHA